MPKEELNNLAIYLQKIREDERYTLSREMHDELGQLLTALRMDIAWLDRGIRDDQPNLRQKINDMIRVLERTIKTVQKICTDLRPSILDDLGVVAAIQWQAKDFEKRFDIGFRFNISSEDIAMEPEDATVFFRVFQEAVTNVSRYAQATEVVVTIKEEGGEVLLEVRDNGRGIPVEKIHDSASFGIMGMRQRLLSRGGKLIIQGEKDKGTTVQATLKLSGKGAVYENSHR